MSNTRTRKLNVTLKHGTVQELGLGVGPEIPFSDDQQPGITVESVPWTEVVLANGSTIPLVTTKFVTTPGNINNTNIISKGGKLFRKAFKTAENSPQEIKNNLKFEGTVQLNDPGNNIVLELTDGKLPEGLEIIPKGSGVFGIEGNALEATVEDFLDDWNFLYSAL